MLTEIRIGRRDDRDTQSKGSREDDFLKPETLRFHSCSLRHHGWWVKWEGSGLLRKQAHVCPACHTGTNNQQAGVSGRQL